MSENDTKLHLGLISDTYFGSDFSFYLFIFFYCFHENVFI